MDRLYFIDNHYHSSDSSDKRLQDLINCFPDGLEINDINDLIELYMIYSIKDDVNFESKFKSIKGFKFIKRRLKGIIHKNLNTIDLLDSVETLDNAYLEIFWGKVIFFANLNKETLKKLMNSNRFFMWMFIKGLGDNESKKVYNDCTKYYINNHPKYIEELFSGLKRDYRNEYYNVYKIIEEDLNKYIELYFCNGGNNSDLCTILAMGKYYGISVSDDNSKKALSYVKDNIFEDRYQKNPYCDIPDNKFIKLKRKINNNVDIFTAVKLFYSISNLFYDKKMGWNITRRKYSGNPILSRTQYIFSSSSFCRAMRQDKVIEILINKGIDFERLFSLYFSEYIPKKLNISGFVFHESNDDKNYFYKCRNLLIELDSVIHQMSLFLKYPDDFKNLDLRLFGTGMTSLKIDSSFVIKNVYANNIETYHDLFSERNIFMVETNADPYDSTYEYLQRLGYVTYDNLTGYEKNDISKLIALDILENNDGKVRFKSDEKVRLMHDIYDNEFIMFNNLSDLEKNIVHDLEDKKLVKFDSHVFSKSETNFFDYLMTNKRFYNNLSIRNSYLHGLVRNDDNNNKRDYVITVKLFILVILKFNEEFIEYSNKNS